MKKLLQLSIFFLVFLTLFNNAEAATLYLSPEATEFGVGQEFSTDVYIGTDEEYINAAQATVTFPNNVLELVSIDRAGSVFRFWVEDPVINNDSGTLSFIGGTVKGITGSSMRLLKMKFKTIGVGSGNISVTDAVVTASDGKGTNVLATVEGATIQVGTEITTPHTPISTAPTSTPAPIPEPVHIERVAVKATNLPDEPQLQVPLYPDPESWYNKLGELTVLWDVPDDAIKVAVVLDQNPNSEPPKAEGDLFTGKKLGSLEEGIWYAHVQFRNNIGWGEVAHHRIAIDTTPPLPFEVETDVAVSDNPSPEIHFDARDEFSGYSHAFVLIDGRNPLTATTTSLILPSQAPGEHMVTIRVFDLAGNSVEDDIKIEVLPLPLPTIEFITESVAFGELVFASGSGVPNGFVDVRVADKNGLEVFIGSGESDATGNWRVTIDEPLKQGRYTLTFSSRDQRGAISFETDPVRVKIKPKTVVSLGLIDLGWFEILAIIVLIILVLAGFLAWRRSERQKTRGAYNVIVKRDVEKLTNLLAGELKKIEDWHFKQEYPNKTVQTEIGYRYKKLHEQIDKMKKYLGREIGKSK